MFNCLFAAVMSLMVCVQDPSIKGPSNDDLPPELRGATVPDWMRQEYRDMMEAKRLKTVADQKIRETKPLLARAVLVLDTIKEKSAQLPPETLRSMRQEWVRTMDRALAMLEEHDVLMLKAVRLLKLPDTSFDRMSRRDTPFMRQYLEATKTVRASMAKPTHDVAPVAPEALTPPPDAALPTSCR